MTLKDYGVLAARAVARVREGAVGTPHYQIHLADDAGTAYRAAVNVLSQESPSELLFVVDEDFRHPLTASLPAAGSGWTALDSQAGGAALDYIRANLFDPAAARPLPPDVPGEDNDLADLLDHYVQRAIGDAGAAVYVFGQRFGPEPQKPDKVFGFLPGNGVHDVHMNQGNSADFRDDDGVWQDGGLLIRLPDARWVAVFLAFQSQAWHTDDTTGHSLDAPPVPGAGLEPMRIVAALANPVGPAPEAESVTLVNASPDPVDLGGWLLADRNKTTLPLPATTLTPGATLAVPGTPSFQLGNRGGAITLLDPSGLKVHGVTYTEDQARREGWTIVF
ncbi:hypothetical protein GCM10023205_17800 [Yinghuangia aomiensis]|uniref:LTD domain-containing protein n=1 Tax=Yinghuangia aomiensis TaxID=676205 RepID=A0ABP9GXJ5_9ACTN